MIPLEETRLLKKLKMYTKILYNRRLIYQTFDSPLTS